MEMYKSGVWVNGCDWLLGYHFFIQELFLVDIEFTFCCYHCHVLQRSRCLNFATCLKFMKGLDFKIPHVPHSAFVHWDLWLLGFVSTNVSLLMTFCQPCLTKGTT